MSDSPIWVIPAITAAAGLLGTIIGGLVAYWTSKRMHEHTTAVEESRQRHQLLREGAIRFIGALSEISVGAGSIERIGQQWGPRAAALVAARDDDEVLAAARAIVPGIAPDGGRIEILIRLLREMGVLDDDVKAATAVLSELRLIAPVDVVDSAQRVLYDAFAQELTATLAPQLNRQASAAYLAEVNEFFNRVRHHLNVENITFDFINEDLARSVLDLERG